MYPDYDPKDSKIGAQKGTGNKFDPFSKNPGMRITLQRHPQLTKKGTLEEDFILPAPPLNELTRTLTYEWGDYQTIAAGQFSRPNGMDLQQVPIDTILVENDYPWAFYNPLRTRGWDAAEQARVLGRILRAGSPFYLIIQQAAYKKAGTSFDFGSVPILKMLASLRTVTPTMKSGEPEVVYVSLSFVEHRSPSVEEKALKKKAGGALAGVGGITGGQGPAKGGPTSSKLPVSIPLSNFATSQSSLHDLATVYYGSASKWTLIKQANPWLGNLTPDHSLGVWDTSELKAAGKANRRLTVPVSG